MTESPEHKCSGTASYNLGLLPLTEVRVNVLRNKTNKSKYKYIYNPNRSLRHNNVYESTRLIFALFGNQYPLLQVSRVKCTYYTVVPLGGVRENTPTI